MTAVRGEKTLNVHFILHEDFEVPGAYWDWARSRGHRTALTKVYESEALARKTRTVSIS